MKPSVAGLLLAIVVAVAAKPKDSSARSKVPVGENVCTVQEM